MNLPDALSRAETFLATRPDLALAQADAILEAVPSHPVAAMIQGGAYRRLGDTARAASVLRALAAAQPGAASVHHEWGLVQAACGDSPGAMASLRRAVRLKPELAQAWRALGDLHTLAGEAAAADAAYAQHIRAGVHDPALREAALALCDDDLPRAEHLLRAHLAVHASDVAALRMLAEVGTRLGRYEDAEGVLAQCLALAPSFTAARYHYALVLFRQGRAQQALPHLESLVAGDAGDITARNLLAACLAMVGAHERSIELYKEVLAAVPGQATIWLSYGHVLKTAGLREACVRAYRSCLALAPGLGEAWWSLANLKNEDFSDGDVAEMSARSGDAAGSVEDRFHLEYALGFAFERRGDYARSFGHYARGARLRRAEVAYSAERTHAQMQRTCALLTRGFFAARQGWGCADASPIFVVGLPRSGSTLVEQILASHSAIEGTMELPEIVGIARDVGRIVVPGGEDGYPGGLARLDPDAARALGERFIARTRVYRKLGRAFFIDKLPNNFVHVGLIQLILPQAKIIDARRHPMAACFSAFKQHFARGQHFSYDLHELGRYYADYLALMAHFDDVLPGRVHRVQYERMVEDTEAETRALLGYLGLEFEAACLRFHENGRAVRTASSEQVRQPIFREGLEHWRHYAPWLAELQGGLATNH